MKGGILADKMHRAATQNALGSDAQAWLTPGAVWRWSDRVLHLSNSGV